MAIALSSLRVTSDMDASAYVRGAAQKVAADERMIAADKARNASLAQADAAMAKAVPGMASVSKSLLAGYSAGQQFEAIVRRIGNAVDRGMNLDRANILLDAAYRKFNLNADAARLAGGGYVAIAPAVDALNTRYRTLAEAAASADAAMRAAATQTGINQSFGIGAAPGRAARDSADAFLAEFGGLEGIARAKAQEAGDAFSAELNARLVGGVQKSARESAAAFSSMFDEMDRIERMRADNIADGIQQALRQAFRMDASAMRFQGADADGRVNVATTSALTEMVRQQEAAEQKAKAVKAAIDPLGAAYVQLAKDVAEYNGLQKAGLLTQEQVARATALSVTRYENVEQSLKKVGNTGRVMGGELVNLSYQLNDVLTGILLGQSPFMIFAQQGGQIIQIFQNSKASVAEFATTAASKLMSFFTVGRWAFGGVAAAAIAGALALKDYAAEQEKVALGLLGAGRASGATIGGINSIAEQAARPAGLSISEARNLAVQLAATGKVANDNILPIVSMGKDIARIFGVEAADAAQLLAKSFSDPVSGAEQLNQRLGFLDAAMQQQIKNLVAQNNLYGAQRTLMEGVASGLTGVSQSVSSSTRFWTALGNAASNTWDKIGAGLSRVTGIGLTVGLDEQVAQARSQLAIAQKAYDQAKEYEGYRKRNGVADLFSGSSDATAEVERLSIKVSDLTAKLQQFSQAAAAAEARQRSFAQAAAVRAQLPEIDKITDLRNAQELLVTAMIDVQATGGASSPILKAMGLSYDQLAASLAVATGNMRTFRSEFDSQLAGLKIASQAITAFSPSQRGEIARQQSLLSTSESKMTPAQKATLAEQAYTNAVKEQVVALSEAARQRILTTEQSTAASRLEVSLVGRNIEEQTRLRAELQARQQLEQESSRNRTAFDNAQFERLKREIDAQAKLKQLEAERGLRSQVNFDSATLFMTPADQQIASQLRQIYGDSGWQQNMNSAIANQMRFNDTLKTAAGYVNDFASSGASALSSSLVDISMHTMSASDGFRNFGNALEKTFLQLIYNLTVVQPLMRAFQAAFSAFGGAMGGGSFAGTGLSLGTTGGLYANGDVFGGQIMPFRSGGAFTNRIAYGPTMFRFADGIGMMGEAGEEAVMPLRRGPTGRLGVEMYGVNDNRGGGNIQVNLYNAPAGTTATTRRSVDRKGNVQLDVIFANSVRDVIRGDMRSGTGLAPDLKEFARTTGFSGN